MTWDSAIQASARISARLGGLTILVSAVLVTLEVISRNLGLGFRFHAFELTNFGFAAAVAFGFSYALAQRAHIRIDILYQQLPVSLRAFLDCLSLLTLFLLAAGMSYYAWGVVAQSAKLGARPNSTLDIPLAVPQAIWASGLTWFMLIALALLLRSVLILFANGPAATHQAFGVMVERGQGSTE
ncbi:TRAP transporter small permease subunit [Hoeflea sp.]|uniref:TRAP transporter small permease subunit n=1 Tax=Hoeflea sp. TaxID=1940281 RepID=UPI003B029E89